MMWRRNLILWMIPGAFLRPICLSGQDFSYPVMADTVHFAGTTIIPLRQDDGVLFPATAQWAAGSEICPVAYPSGNAPEVSASFTFTCASFPVNVWVKALGPDGISFPAVNCAVSSGRIHYPFTASAGTLPIAKALKYAPFSLHWQISYDGTHWYAADTTEHTLYVTLASPLPEGDGTGFQYFETVFDVSCRNGHGASSIPAILDSVWKDFEDRSVTDAHGNPLSYYCGSYSWYLNEFCYWKSGACGAWSYFLLSLLKIHGFKETGNVQGITFYSAPGSCGEVNMFLVHNWTFGAPSALCPQYPWLGAAPAYGVPWTYSEVIDMAGAPGQSCADPPSVFVNHYMARINGTIYDASYGKRYASLNAFKAESVAGFGHSELTTETALGFDVNGNTILDTDTIVAYRITNDTTAASISQWTDSW